MSTKLETPSVAAPMGRKPTIDIVREARGITRPEVDPAEKRRKPIAGDKIRLAQFKRNMWVVVVPDDLPVDEMENPLLWMHTSREWLWGDRIEIHQSQRFTEGFVVDVGMGAATIKVLHSFDLPARQYGKESLLPPGYSIRPGSPDESPFVVVRDSDGYVMNRNNRHSTFNEAKQWLLSSAIFR